MPDGRRTSDTEATRFKDRRSKATEQARQEITREGPLVTLPVLSSGDHINIPHDQRCLCGPEPGHTQVASQRALRDQCPRTQAEVAR